MLKKSEYVLIAAIGMIVAIAVVVCFVALNSSHNAQQKVKRVEAQELVLRQQLKHDVLTTSSDRALIHDHIFKHAHKSPSTGAYYETADGSAAQPADTVDNDSRTRQQVIAYLNKVGGYKITQQCFQIETPMKPSGWWSAGYCFTNVLEAYGPAKGTQPKS